MTSTPVTQTLNDGERLLELYQNLWATDADLEWLKECRNSETSLQLLTRLVLPERHQSVLDVPISNTEVPRPANLEMLQDIGQRTLDAFISETGEAATYKRLKDTRESAAEELRTFVRHNSGRLVTVTQLPDKYDTIYSTRAMRCVLSATGEFWVPYDGFDHHNMSDFIVKKRQHFGRRKIYDVLVRNNGDLDPSIAVDFED